MAASMSYLAVSCQRSSVRADVRALITAHRGHSAALSRTLAPMGQPMVENLAPAANVLLESKSLATLIAVEFDAFRAEGNSVAKMSEAVVTLHTFEVEAVGEALAAGVTEAVGVVIGWLS